MIKKVRIRKEKEIFERWLKKSIDFLKKIAILILEEMISKGIRKVLKILKQILKEGLLW